MAIPHGRLVGYRWNVRMRFGMQTSLTLDYSTALQIFPAFRVSTFHSRHGQHLGLIASARYAYDAWRAKNSATAFLSWVFEDRAITDGDSWAWKIWLVNKSHGACFVCVGQFEVPQQATLRPSSWRTATSHSTRSRLHLRRSQTVYSAAYACSRWLFTYYRLSYAHYSKNFLA